MATFLANLKTTRDNMAARLAEITASPKPTYSIDGESYSWESYQSMLAQQLASLNQLIAAQEPFLIRSRGRS